jgi:hypothetical protein
MGGGTMGVHGRRRLGTVGCAYLNGSVAAVNRKRRLDQTPRRTCRSIWESAGGRTRGASGQFRGAEIFRLPPYDLTASEPMPP